MNSSGIYPSGNRVVVRPDKVEETTPGGIALPKSELNKYQLATLTGFVVAVGPDAWRHTTKDVYRVIDGDLKLVETHITGYSEPFAEVGNRVTFARYAGLPAPGEDGEEYRILNDEDITAVISEKIDFSEFRPRESIK